MKKCFLLIQSDTFPMYSRGYITNLQPHITQLLQQLDTQGAHMGFINI